MHFQFQHRLHKSRILFGNILKFIDHDYQLRGITALYPVKIFLIGILLQHHLEPRRQFTPHLRALLSLRHLSCTVIKMLLVLHKCAEQPLFLRVRPPVQHNQLIARFPVALFQFL